MLKTGQIKLVEAWKQSGMTQKEFCRQSSVNLYTFKDWLKKYRDAESTKFIPLDMSQPNASARSTATKTSTTQLEVRLGLLEIKGDAETISDLILHLTQKGVISL